MANPGRIDFHQHVIPPFWLEKVRGSYRSTGGLLFPKLDWSTSSALGFMEQNDVAMAILSVTVPGADIDGVDRAEFAREVNEFVADAVRDHPDRLAFYTTLPIPEMESSLEEVAYAFDQLNARGVLLPSNTRGTYLGDPLFDPLFDELNRRGALILVHPTDIPGATPVGLPAPLADFVLDTTRAAFTMVKQGVPERYPNLKIVLSHAGGMVPYIAHRFAALFSSSDYEPDRSREKLLEGLKSFYFDTALAAGPTLAGLMAFADPGHVLYGSDYPLVDADNVRYFSEALDAAALDGVLRANARAVLG